MNTLWWTEIIYCISQGIINQNSIDITCHYRYYLHMFVLSEIQNDGIIDKL